MRCLINVVPADIDPIQRGIRVHIFSMLPLSNVACRPPQISTHIYTYLDIYTSNWQKLAAYLCVGVQCLKLKLRAFNSYSRYANYTIHTRVGQQIERFMNVGTMSSSVTDHIAAVVVVVAADNFVEKFF